MNTVILISSETLEFNNKASIKSELWKGQFSILFILIFGGMLSIYKKKRG